MKERNWLNMFNPDFPTTFSDAISYYEQLKIAYDKMSECLHYLKTHEDEMAKLAEKISRETAQNLVAQSESRLNSKIDGVEEKLETLISTQDAALRQLIARQIQLVQDTVSQIANEMDRFETHTNNRFLNLIDGMDEITREINMRLMEITTDLSTLETSIYTLESEMNTFKMHVTGMFKNELEILTQKIDEQIARVNGDRILVTNPLSGKKEGLHKVLVDIAQYQAPFPIKFSEYNRLKITFEQYNAMKITFLDYNNRAGLIFLRQLQFPHYDDDISHLQAQIDNIYNTKWVSMLSMGLMTPYDAYRELTDYVLKNVAHPITFSDYNALEITVNDYNEKNITVNEYATNADTILFDLPY